MKTFSPCPQWEVERKIDVIKYKYLSGDTYILRKVEGILELAAWVRKDLEDDILLHPLQIVGFRLFFFFNLF